MSDNTHSLAIRVGIFLTLLGVVLRVAIVCGYVASTNVLPTPFLSANDRSRWCTVRALVEDGTYAIDNVVLQNPREPDESLHQFDPGWETADMVRHRGHDGREHYYSSKPPLLPTMVAGVYWVVKAVSGGTLANRPFWVAGTILSIVNTAMMLGFLMPLVAIARWYGKSDWAVIYVAAAGCTGTLITSFAATFNNHLPAAMSVMIALWATLAVMRRPKTTWPYMLAGLFAAFAVANELPALAFFAIVSLAVLWRSPTRALLFFAPAALLVVVAFFLTTYIAHDSLRPPYMHRQDGNLITEFQQSRDNALRPGVVSPDLQKALQNALGHSLSANTTLKSREGLTPAEAAQQRFSLFDQKSQQRYAVQRQGHTIQIRSWNNWYDYEQSYWKLNEKAGVDQGEESRAVYAFHMLVGHHGWFSLTPIWLLSLGGMAIFIHRGLPEMRVVAIVAIVLTVVVAAFYIARPQRDRNYGGNSCGMRWLLWLVPFWLVSLLPIVDMLRNSRIGVVALFGGFLWSFFSVAWSCFNPWDHPWIYRLFSNYEV